MKEFNFLVWSACKKIPKGKVSTYKEIAKAIGKPKAFRAVGNALNKNPFSPVVPCHRVVKSNGELGGFSSGKLKKKRLLESEGIVFEKTKIKDFEKKLFKF
jgi:methylated-DNA-[protein]-cysteine S-methyltransferase